MKRVALAIAISLLPAMAQEAQQRFIGTANGWYPWSAEDKFRHFELGVGAGMIVYTFFNEGLELKHSMWLTAFTMALIGMTKEWYDRHHHGTPEYADAANTFAGGMVGAQLIYRIRF